ncbi:aspartate racemase/maleate isomerase family protein [Streptomyces litchfieldiae]|uniref:Aspartate/glutamate racemase family protein n=1 Tax=Streptomyces litchfieldiae TaxID=3075543 RepID=A0ABU2MRT1_9ACTN|nr:aspartate/glutamate racemase family protein [Streptomyces sp. DSM 44938]MDT0344127.1 aspartate/glutamate racemase family protein [Streptomyces sp. DSM 44938]
MENALPPLPDGTLNLLASLDAAAVRTARVGILLPWANVAVEAELPRLGLVNTVFHHARLVPAARGTAIDASFWEGLCAASLDAVDSLSHVPLDSVILACTSAGFAEGCPLPIGVVTAFDALVDTLAISNLHRVVLVTPYPAAVTRAESAALAEAGISVLAGVGLGLVDGYPDVTRDQVRALVNQLPAAAVREADAVVLSCTGWHTLSLISALQRRLGRPVLSSNLAIGLMAARISAGVTA